MIEIKKMLFLQIENILLYSKKPSIEIGELIKQNKFDIYPFSLIRDLKNIEQNKKNHPEGNVLNHTLLVVDQASFYKNLSKNKRVFMWASLMHDIGKLNTTKRVNNKITAYNHDLESDRITREFLSDSSFNDLVDKDFIEGVCKLVKYHMQPTFFYNKKPFFDADEVIKNVDIEELCLISLCDRLGRNIKDDNRINREMKKIKEFKRYLYNYKK